MGGLLYESELHNRCKGMPVGLSIGQIKGLLEEDFLTDPVN